MQRQKTVTAHLKSEQLPPFVSARHALASSQACPGPVNSSGGKKAVGIGGAGRPGSTVTGAIDAGLARGARDPDLTAVTPIRTSHPDCPAAPVGGGGVQQRPVNPQRLLATRRRCQFYARTTTWRHCNSMSLFNAYSEFNERWWDGEIR